MWSIIYQGLQKNLIMAIIFLIGFGYLFTEKVATADLNDMEKKQDTLHAEVAQIRDAQKEMQGEFRGLAKFLTGGKRETFNHVVNRWPPSASPPYLLYWSGTPPTPDGWDSCKVANFVKPGQARPVAICFYTDSTGTNITELE